MRKLIASIALGLAAFGLLGVSHAQDTAASAPVAASAVAEATAPASAPDAAPAATPAAPEAASAAAAPAPVPNKGDTTWMMVSTLLVILMTVPGLALFYGGLVRSKNMLSVLMQVMVTFSLIVVLWFVYGYSLAFTEGNAFIGGMDRLFMKGIWDNVAGTFANGATFSKGVYIPEIVFAAFQATFAGITCCLIVGAFAERIKFSAVLLFMVLWFTFSYIPMAHMVWFWMGPDAYTSPEVVDAMNAKAGLIWQHGALDFAGGTVVHINAAVAGLVGAYMVGKRIGYGKEAFTPHSLTLTMVGASLLWVGWFGFNAGSALEANGFAALAFVNTLAATAAVYDNRRGRDWRPVQDTTNDPIIANRRPLSWLSWQRSEDYYSEGMLVWLDADTVIREKTGGKKSLDDFAKAFFGVDSGSFTPHTYTFEDVVKTLNDVTPYDWSSFLKTRIEEVQEKAPLDGFERGGYKALDKGSVDGVSAQLIVEAWMEEQYD